MRKYKHIIIGALVVIVVLGLAVWFGRPDSKSQTANTIGPAAVGALKADKILHDFGSISMAGGKVSTIFAVKNTGSVPITVSKLYTSCMCTVASINGKGPFGMPGHGVIPRINEKIEAGAEIPVEVVFDPAAHGPAGVGRIERNVYLEGEGGAKLLELRIRAMVTP